MDCEVFRDFLLFNCGTALNRDTGEVFRSSPDLAISRHMGIDYPGARMAAWDDMDIEYERRRYKLGTFLEETLVLARTQEAMIDEYGEAHNVNGLTPRFNKRACCFDVLSILYGCFEDWPVTLDLLKQTARGAFARENYEEGVFHKGQDRKKTPNTKEYWRNTHVRFFTKQSAMHQSWGVFRLGETRAAEAAQLTSSLRFLNHICHLRAPKK